MTIHEKYMAALQLIKDIQTVTDDKTIHKLINRFSKEWL